MTRIEELIFLVDSALRAAQRDFDILKREIAERDATHPGQPVGWGNEAEDEFNAQ